MNRSRATENRPLSRRPPGRRGRTLAWTAVAVLSATLGCSAQLPADPTGTPAPGSVVEPARASDGSRGRPGSPPGRPPRTWQLQSEPNPVGGCPGYDRTSVFHSLVTGLPVHPRSDEWISHMGATSPVKAAIRSSVWDGTRPGYPVNVVDSATTPSTFVLYGPDQPAESWVNPVPIPANPRIEGDPTPNWDKHLLIVDSATCQSFELFHYERLWHDLIGVHWAVGGSRWMLDGTGGVSPQRGSTAADAPLLGTVVRADEVATGRIDHPVGACSNRTGPSATWPARRGDGTDPSPSAIPIGTRLRLRDTVDVSRFSGQSAVIAGGLRDHGVMVIDTCFTPLTILGENTPTGWDDDDLEQLQQLHVGDFEVVDVSPMIVSEDSWRVR